MYIMLHLCCVSVICFFHRCPFIVYFIFCVFFFKQKTAYEMRISDWSSDVCSSDLKEFISPIGCVSLHPFVGNKLHIFADDCHALRVELRAVAVPQKEDQDAPNQL